MSYTGNQPQFTGTDAEGQEIEIILDTTATANDAGFLRVEGNSTASYGTNICLAKYADKQSGNPYVLVENQDGAGSRLSTLAFGVRNDHKAFWQHENGYSLKIEASGGGLGKIEVGEVNVNAAYTLPTADGTSGQAITTDGAGNLSFGAVLSNATYDPGAIAEQVVGLTATQTLSNKTLTAPEIGAATGTSLATTGDVTVDGNIIANGSSSVVRLKGYTVAGLPSGTQGDTAFVTDALTPVSLTTVTGGGAVVVPVFFDGTNWIVS